MAKAKKIDAKHLKLPVKKAEVTKTNPTATKAEEVVKEIHPNATTDKEELVRFTLDIPKSMHRNMKMRVLEKDESMKDYILGLVTADLKQAAAK